MNALDDQTSSPMTDAGMAEPATSFTRKPLGEPARLALDMAIADYDRTRPLLDGRVAFEGIDAKIVTVDIGTFCKRPVYEEFDIAEMSLSWYLAARCRGEPVIALPVFPLRMPVFAYMFCRSDSVYTKPSDLVGKRVGSMGYRYTVNLWLRGILKDHYGLSPEQVTWVTGEREGAGFVVPAGIRVEVVEDRSDEELLLAGEIDAIFSPVIPEAFIKGDRRIRRLFPDAAREQAHYFEQTGILPITHVIVTGERFARDNKWVAERVIRGFREAQELLEAYYDEPKNLSFPDGVFLVEATRRTYGRDVWSHGVESNRKNLETFVRYARDQGYISYTPALEELFPDYTLKL
jgi:4,5-dihydroxyphthalate decarboxylase